MICAAPGLALLPGGCGGGSSGSSNSSNYQLAATLDYSQVSTGSNAFTARIATLDTAGSNFSGAISTGANQQSVNFSGINRIVGNTTERRIIVQLASPSGRRFAVGQEIPLAVGTQSTILLRQSSSGNTPGDRIWNSDGGTATVTAIGADSISLRLNNARFVPSPAFLGTGTFLLNGPIAATGLRDTNSD